MDKHERFVGIFQSSTYLPMFEKSVFSLALLFLYKIRAFMRTFVVVLETPH